MIPKSGYRFSDKIMLKQEAGARASDRGVVTKPPRRYRKLQLSRTQQATSAFAATDFAVNVFLQIV